MPTTAEIILLNWNGRAFLEACLTHLLAQTYPHFRLTVVDNGSTDDSVDYVKQNFPQVTLTVNDQNVGFAAGNNPALQASTADIAILLNPDVMVSPDWLAQLMARFEADPEAAIVGCKLWYPGGDIIQHAGGYITPPQAMPGHFGIGQSDDGRWDEPRDCDYVIGAALALRTAVLPVLGLLDEGYFLYYEDVDLCARARRGGGRVIYEPAATAIHVESATAVKGSFNYLRRFHTGRWRYLLKQEAVEILIEETIAAEHDWLSRIDLDERLAVALAYQTTLATLDGIWQARERNGAGPLPTGPRHALAEAVTALEETAWTLPGVAFPELEGSSALMRLFRSRHATLLAAHEATVDQQLVRIARLLREQTEARVAAETEMARMQAELQAMRRQVAASEARANETNPEA